MDVLPKGTQVNSKVYHSILVRFIKWLAEHLKTKVSKLRRKGLTFQQDEASCQSQISNCDQQVARQDKEGNARRLGDCPDHQLAAKFT